MKKVMMIGVIASLLVGCQSSAQRMADCEAQGVSRDACYIAEQNRKATINAAAEKQALENAAHAVQYAQAVHIKNSYRGYGVVFAVDTKTGHATLNNHLCAVDEITPDAITYSQGLQQVIKYRTGKVALMTQGQFTGYLK